MPERWHGVYALNPMAGIVEGFRFRQKLNEPKDAVYVLLSL